MRPARIALSTLVFLLLAPGCAKAPQTEVVRICDSSGCSDRPVDEENAELVNLPEIPDPDGRIASLHQLAETDARAAYDLSLRYFRGDGVRRDSHKALQWMRQAAGGGDLDAQKAVGRFYLTGLEVMGPDPKEAQKWLTMAAAQGDAESASLLKEAEAARQVDDDYYKWQSRWRPIFHRHWYSGYGYHGRWHDGRWGY